MHDRTQDGREVGLYVEPHVTIENKGPRTATIESYDIRFHDVAQIKPQQKVRSTPMSPNPVYDLFRAAEIILSAQMRIDRPRYRRKHSNNTLDTSSARLKFFAAPHGKIKRA
jgi:hypothetical protein